MSQLDMFSEAQALERARVRKAEKLRQAFQAFHQANPWVYDRIKTICFDLWKAGHRRYSMRTIIAVLRFEADLQTRGEDVMVKDGELKRLKLNNNHSPYYARLLIEQYPQFADFFERRRAEGE